MDQEYVLIISPAINYTVRHQLQQVIENSGYYEILSADMNFLDDTMSIKFKEITKSGAGCTVVEKE